MSNHALEIRDLTVIVPTGSGPRAAVRNVTLDVEQSETVALVGESGSGKTLTALAAMGLLAKVGATLSSGSVWLFGGDRASAQGDRQHRAVALIPQEPLDALDPVFTIGSQVIEAVRAHAKIPKREARVTAIRLLRSVGLPDPAATMKQYPHQFSGGMRQRVLIAMALAVKPRLLVADEPTTALDVTVQAQVLQLLRDIARDSAMGVLLITHDMGVAAQLADRILVMYAGRVVESGVTAELLARPRHPYTRDLLAAVPTIEGPLHELPTVAGRVPAPGQASVGCPFQPRCARAEDICARSWPESETGDRHPVHCWFPLDLAVSRG